MLQVNFQNLPKLSFRVNEAYKSLRTNIQFCGSGVKMICITSCLPNEGKSNVSFNLATSLAECGKKVIFIDADLRRSVIIGRYKPDQAVVGLTHYLSGQNKIDEILYETNIDNLDIIFTGPVPPNPSELLASDNFSDLIKIFRKVYDYIIIDTPPIGSVIDSAIVAQKCDGVVLVIESNTVSYKFAQRAIRQLEKSQSKILGAVLNKYENEGRLYGYESKKSKKYIDYYLEN
ncbi:MAG: polysaccharide biosynthesis tyrosine autokinase [Anaerolineaceae bacterium]|nr:MAG: polysaccharide biosynthesis tyrosine autokinase [Anaerolineaceae bacterium]